MNEHKDTCKKISDIISNILGDSAGSDEYTNHNYDDNFFDMGIDSIATVILYGAIEEEFGVELPMDAVWKFPTIRGVASYIERSKES